MALMIGSVEFVFWVLVWAVICGIVASVRGRSGLGWAVLGLLFSPLALILLMCLPDLSKMKPMATTANTPASLEGESVRAWEEAYHKRVREIKAAHAAPAADATMQCPECAETIKAAAKVCRFCGHRLAPSVESSAG